ncbi:glycosyltransferase family 4 protein [Litorivicinus sp.]|nr:glycosyltransferase family 4 protein [Litorivicinus sp.]
MQCDALARSGANVSIYAKRAVFKQEDLASAIQQQYGVDFSKARLCTFWSKAKLGDNIRIALHAVIDLIANPWPDAILSRNLYAAYLIANVLRKPLIFETHQLESGFCKYLQRKVMTCRHVSTIAISEKLVECLTAHHGIAPFRPHVLHDAAPEGIYPISIEKRRSQLEILIPKTADSWSGVCGYIGHLYKGRGIEIIEAMAAARPSVLFLVCGGNDSEIETKRLNNLHSNLLFCGHVAHGVALNIMGAVNILLMPYQRKVSIGSGNHDTARWMSPMKMFEYMSSSVPIISSDLPVLREILTDGENALLVPPEKVDCWIQAMDRLLTNRDLAAAIGSNAYKDYQNKHTWTIRAKSIISIANNL